MTTEKLRYELLAVAARLKQLEVEADTHMKYYTSSKLKQSREVILEAVGSLVTHD